MLTIFSILNHKFPNVLDLRPLQEQVKKAFCFNKNPFVLESNYFPNKIIKHDHCGYILRKEVNVICVHSSSPLKLVSCILNEVLKVSPLGVDSLWGDCTFIPADWGP